MQWISVDHIALIKSFLDQASLAVRNLQSKNQIKKQNICSESSLMINSMQILVYAIDTFTSANGMKNSYVFLSARESKKKN